MVRASDAAAIGAGPRLHGAPPTHLTFDALTAVGLPHATTTRLCPTTPVGAATGPFSVEANETLAAAGVRGRVAFARQVHGTGVARVVAGGSQGEADVLVTTTPLVPLAIVTADCLPIVLHDPHSAVLAVAHVGWRGTVKRAPRAAVEALVELGARPSRIIATIGPSIGPCCYEVDEVVVEALAAAFTTVDAWVTPVAGGGGDAAASPGPGRGAAHPSRRERSGPVGTRGRGRRWMLDLRAVNEHELIAAGVDPRNVHHARLCTSCRTDLFHSYRRGSRGRLVSLAMLPSLPAGPERAETSGRAGVAPPARAASPPPATSGP